MDTKINQLAGRQSINVVQIPRKDGFDPLGSYPEWFWLPIIGPSALWTYRRLVTRLDAFGSYEQSIPELATEMGLGEGTGRNSPMVKTLARLASFGFTGLAPNGTYGVCSLAPTLDQRKYERLTPRLQKLYDEVIINEKGSSK